MKVSEKSLELNIGAEILDQMRNGLGMTKTYLRGLTQREEKREGVDFFLRLDRQTRFFAFQFKAPKGSSDGSPYRYTIQKDQHEALFDLAQSASNSVFYVFPHYVTATKLQEGVPNLMNDTWLLSVDQMTTGAIFGTRRSKTVRCEGGRAIINPNYGMHRFQDAALKLAMIRGGVGLRQIQQWYSRIRSPSATAKNSSLVRGLRIAVVLP